jgi:RNase P subunit RPR2
MSDLPLFVRRGKARGTRSIRIHCLECGWNQYDINPGSKKGEASELVCPSCGMQGRVEDRP